MPATYLFAMMRALCCHALLVFIRITPFYILSSCPMSGLQHQRQNADSNHDSELAGNNGVLRLADALSLFSCASGSNGAVVGTCWPPQSSAAASRRTSVAQQLAEERNPGAATLSHFFVPHSASASLLLGPSSTRYSILRSSLSKQF